MEIYEQIKKSHLWTLAETILMTCGGVVSVGRGDIRKQGSLTLGAIMMTECEHGKLSRAFACASKHSFSFVGSVFGIYNGLLRCILIRCRCLNFAFI